MIRKIINNTFAIEKGKKIPIYKKVLFLGCTYFLVIILYSIETAFNQFVIDIKKFFSIPSNVTMIVIGISMFVGFLLATIWKVKKDAERKRLLEAKIRKAEYEESMRLEEEERIKIEKERQAELIRIEKKKKEEVLKIEKIKEEKEAERLRLKKEKISKIKAEEKRKLRDLIYAQHFLKYISEILDDYLIIDSNIWMGNDYDNFFEVISEACYNYKRTLNIHGVQFDEIVNIKNKYKFETIKGKKARCAIGRIERLQKENCLEIRPITIDAKQDAYADPVLIKCLLDQAQNGVKTTLISNDKELCIRARQLLKNESAQNWAVLDFDKLLNDCKIYVKTKRYNFDINCFSSKVASELPN